MTNVYVFGQILDTVKHVVRQEDGWTWTFYFLLRKIETNKLQTS